MSNGTILRSIELIDNHANVSGPTTLRSVSVIDHSGAYLLSLEPATPNKRARIELRLRLFAYWPMLLAAVVVFAVGMFCLVEAGKMRQTGSDQARLAEDIPARSTVTLGQALQAVSVRH
jgi:hypothetical protein